MSAYLVARATIDALVAGAKAQGPGRYYFYAGGDFSLHCEFSNWASDSDSENLVFNDNTLGRMLWTENLLSIQARYPDTIGHSEVPGSLIGEDVNAAVATYTYTPGPRVVQLDPLGLLGVINGYGYQTCEHKEWRSSIAKGFVDTLQGGVIRKLIELTGANAWTIDDLDEVTGELAKVRRERAGWTLQFTPGASAAVSITDMIAKGQRNS